MKMMRCLLTLGALGMAVAAFHGLASSARAQAPGSPNYVPNTYADFPYNQGSLFYRYRPTGSATYTRPRQAAPRRGLFGRPLAPRTTYYYPQTQQRYYYPQATYRPY